MKTIESKIAPNPKEAQIWVDLNADPHGSIRKYWNGVKWVSDKKESVSKEDIMKEITPELNALKNKLNELSTWLDKSLSNIIRDLSNRISKLEESIVTE